jgi:cobalt-zinc-cadmium efflux system outer membrane protein
VINLFAAFGCALNRSGLFIKQIKAKRDSQMRLKSIIFLILSLYATTLVAWDELSVGRALQIAREKNPQINQLRQLIEMKRGSWWSSFGIADPKITYFKEGINTGLPESFAEKRWTIEQSLDFPLTSYYRLQKISLEEQSLKSRLHAACLALKAEIKTSYTDLAFSLELLHLRQEQLRIAEELRNAAITRVEVGESSELDLMKADILLAEAQNDVEEARRAFHSARYTLFKTIGLDPEDQSYHISFPDTLEFVDIEIDQEAILSTLENQPEYFSAAQALQSADYQLSEAWSAILPSLDFSYYRQRYGEAYDHFGYQIGFTFPLWFAFNQRGAIQEAKAQQRYYEWQKTDVNLELKKRLEITWHSYEVAKMAIERYHDQIRNKAARLRDLTMEGYRAGEIDQLTLLEAQRTYLISEKNYFEVLRTYYLRLIELEKYIQKDLVFSKDQINCQDE